MASHQEWARAFARQANADWAARSVILRHAEVPSCQQLHFLQMACEKLCKAHLYLYRASPQRSHAYVAKNLPIIFKEVYQRRAGKRPSHGLYQKIRELSLKIERLAPAVSPADNCEYPWEDAGGQLRVPAEHDFGATEFTRQSAGVELLKLVPHAINDVLQGK